MSSENNSLQDVIAAFLDAVATGQTPDRALLLAAHPDLADDLRAFFADHDRMTQAAMPLRDALAETPPGETFPQAFGDYQLLAEIGRGGMGVVYKARQLSLNRIVALKRIRAGQLASPEEVARFRREAEAAAGLDHPHIVPIYEVGEHAGQHYFTMKLIDGGNLNAHLARFADAKATAELMIQIARAVHHAHQRGILHRDLKPGNILIDADGNPHVSDFGLAQSIEKEAKLTQSGAILGTPEYMAPEQARGEKGLTTAADVYGLGAILYVLLTGRPPFQGDYNWETLKRVVEEEPVSPRSINWKADRELETICLACLEKKPSNRYGSAETLASDLQNTLDGKPIDKRRASLRERLWKWAKRRPAAAALYAVTIVGLVMGPTGAFWLSYERTARIAEEALRQAEEKLARERQWSLWMEQVRIARGDGQRGEALTLLKKLVNLRKEHSDVGDPVQLHEEAFKTITAPGATLLCEIAMGWVGDHRRLLSADGTYFLTNARRVGDKDSKPGPKTWCVFLDGREPVSRSGDFFGFWDDEGLVVVHTDKEGQRLWDPVKNVDVPGEVNENRPAAWKGSSKNFQSDDNRWLANGVNVGNYIEITDTARSESFRLGTGLRENAQQILSFHPTRQFVLTKKRPHLGTNDISPRGLLPLWDLETRRELFRLNNNPLVRMEADAFGPAHSDRSNERRTHEWSKYGDTLLVETDVAHPRGVSGGGFRAWRITHPAPTFTTFSGSRRLGNRNRFEDTHLIRELFFSSDGKWLHSDELFWKVDRRDSIASLIRTPSGPISSGEENAMRAKQLRLGNGKVWEFVEDTSGKNRTYQLDEKRPLVIARSHPDSKEYRIPASGGSLLTGAVSPTESYTLLVYSWSGRDKGNYPFLHPNRHKFPNGWETWPWFELWDIRLKTPKCVWRSQFVPDFRSCIAPQFQEDEKAFSLFLNRPSEFHIPSRKLLEGNEKMLAGPTRGTAYLDSWQGRVSIPSGTHLSVDLEEFSTERSKGPFGKHLPFCHYTMSADQRLLALSSRWDTSNSRTPTDDDLLLWLWDLRTGKLLLRWKPHDVPLTALALSNDGSTLATTGDDGTIRLWNIDYYLSELRKLGLSKSWPAGPNSKVRPPKVESTPRIPDANNLQLDMSQAENTTKTLITLGRPVIPLLMKRLTNPKEEERIAGAFFLGQLAPWAEDARLALHDALKDESEKVRYVAAEALGEIGLTPESEAVLKSLEQDPDIKVRLLLRLIQAAHREHTEIEPIQAWPPLTSNYELSRGPGEQDDFAYLRCRVRFLREQIGWLKHHEGRDDGAIRIMAEWH